MRHTDGPRSLTLFCHTVQDASVRDALRYYTLEGPMGALLDGERSNLSLSRVTVFEMAAVMAMGEKVVVPVLTYLFRFIEKRLDGSPTLIPLDEAWRALGAGPFRARIREWLKELRKLNVALVPATQSLSDAVQSGIFDVLVESCPTKIYLPNAEAERRGPDGMPGPYEFYCALGLNDVEIHMLATATPKRHYYYSSPDGKRLFDLVLGPVALSFVGVSSKEDRARIAVLQRQHGDAWPFAWLDERGVDYARYIEAAPVAA